MQVTTRLVLGCVLVVGLLTRIDDGSNRLDPTDYRHLIAATRG